MDVFIGQLLCIKDECPCNRLAYLHQFQTVILQFKPHLIIKITVCLWYGSWGLHLETGHSPQCFPVLFAHSCTPITILGWTEQKPHCIHIWVMFFARSNGSMSDHILLNTFTNCLTFLLSDASILDWAVLKSLLAPVNVWFNTKYPQALVIVRQLPKMNPLVAPWVGYSELHKKKITHEMAIRKPWVIWSIIWCEWDTLQIQ